MTSRNFLTIDDFDTHGKTILIRVDLNSPMDPQGNILDDMRIRSHIATLKDLEDAKVVLLAHQSRPGKKRLHYDEASCSVNVQVSGQASSICG